VRGINLSAQASYLPKFFVLVLVNIMVASGLGTRSGSTEPLNTSPESADSLNWVRQEIVGTWIEDVSEQVGNFKKGSHKWVFTSSGTLRKYQNGELKETTDYTIDQQCEDKHLGLLEAAPTQTAMLKEVSPDGSTRCVYIDNISKDGDGPPEPPFLLVGTRNGTIFFGKYSSTQ